VSDLLLDTHAVIWLSRDPDQLPSTLRRSIDDAQNVFASAVSLWEIAIKESGPSPMVGTHDALEWFTSFLATAGLTLLPIELRHVGAVQHLPTHHGDPFDRLLIAQARVEQLTIVSRDRQLSRYDVSVIWDEPE